MKTLLQLNSSIFSSEGHSTQLANRFVNTWLSNNPGAQMIIRDLAKAPLSHLDASSILAFMAAQETRTPEQQVKVDLSDKLIAEIKQADVIVIGLPMYNFGIPSTLKAYFDQIARAGITFRYTDQGPEGLLSDKKVYIFATRGGHYAGSALDTQTSYVRNFLNFLGIIDITFVYAEGLNMGEPSKSSAMQTAEQQISALAA